MTTPERTHTGSDGSGDRIRQAGQDAVSDATEQARASLDRGRSTAADSAASTSEVLDHTAEDLRAHGQETLASATSMLAGQLSNFATQLESRSLEELAQDARGLAQRNPALFVAGGVAVGLALGRFFKASTPAPGSASGAAGVGGDRGESAQRSGGPAYGGEGAPPSQGSGRAASASSAAGTSHPVGASSTAGPSAATDPASTAQRPDGASSNSGNQGGKP